MRIRQLVLGLFGLVLLVSVPKSAWASEDENEDEDEDEDDDFFNFYDDTNWSDYSIMPTKCLTLNDKDVVVFEIYGANNNQCTKKMVGTYTTTLSQFLKAWTKQAEEDAEMMGNDFDDPDYLDHLSCQGYAPNDDTYIYYKISCFSGTGRNFAIKTYSDAYCTEEVENSNYQPDVDISYLKYHMRFGYCQACVNWPSNDDDANGNNVDDQFYSYHAYESPLCSANWYYKSDCDRKCKRLANSVGQSHSREFSRAGKFWLFLFSLLGIVLLVQVVKERKKMSTEDTLTEEASIQKAGLKKRQVALIILAIIVLILMFIIFKVKALAWVLLLSANFLLLGYLAYLRYRSRGKVEVGGFRLYGDDEQQQAASDSRQAGMS